MLKFRFLKKLNIINRYLNKPGINSLQYRLMKYMTPNVEKIVIIDVGANRGRFYDEISSIFPKTNIKALLIEPIPDCIKVLEFKYKTTETIKISQAVISDKIQDANFFINSFDETSSLLNIKKDLNELKNVNSHTEQTMQVLTNTLDNVVQDFNFFEEAIDILKIDVQGSETKVLLGANKTLQKTRYIWIEVSFKALYEKSCLFNDVHLMLSKLNFILLEIADGYRSSDKELLQANCLYRNVNLK